MSKALPGHLPWKPAISFQRSERVAWSERKYQNIHHFSDIPLWLHASLPFSVSRNTILGIDVSHHPPLFLSGGILGLWRLNKKLALACPTQHTWFPKNILNGFSLIYTSPGILLSWEFGQPQRPYGVDTKLPWSNHTLTDFNPSTALYSSGRAGAMNRSGQLFLCLF